MKKSNSKVKFLIGRSISSESLNSIIESSPPPQSLTQQTETSTLQDTLKNENSILKNTMSSNGSNDNSPEHSIDSSASKINNQHLR
jgi:hypothetical protein